MSEHSTEGEFDFDMDDIDEAIIHSIPQRKEDEMQDFLSSLQTYEVQMSSKSFTQTEISLKTEDKKSNYFDPEQILIQANALLQDKQQLKVSDSSQMKNGKNQNYQAKKLANPYIKQSPFETTLQKTQSSQPSYKRVNSPTLQLRIQNPEINSKLKAPYTQYPSPKAKENVYNLEQLMEKQLQKNFQQDRKKMNYQPMQISKALHKENNSKNNRNQKDFIKQNIQRIQSKAKTNLQSPSKPSTNNIKNEIIIPQQSDASSFESGSQFFINSQNGKNAKNFQMNGYYSRQNGNLQGQDVLKMECSQNMEKNGRKQSSSPKQQLNQPQNSFNKVQKQEKNLNIGMNINFIYYDQQEEDSGSRSTVPAERLQDYKRNADLKTQLLKEKLDQEKFKECTFMPQLKTNRDGRKEKSPRPLKEFLDSQQQHQKLIQEKIQIIQKVQQAAAKGCYNQQKQFLCNGSRKILSKKDQPEKPAFQRLYQMHELFQQKTEVLKAEKDRKQRQGAFTPEITSKSKNIIRDKSVDTILYEDAQRRALTPVERRAENLEQKSKSYQVSQKSNKLLRERLQQELVYYYEQLVSSLCTEEKLNYIGLQKLLQEMYFVEGDINSPTYNQEKQLTKIM